MRAYLRCALAALSVTYLLVFIGGLVRVSGAGLGCPDWPRCFGGWYPPLNQMELQARLAATAGSAATATAEAAFEPASFNFTLAWIEYLNRLVGVVVGLAIVALLVAAWRVRRADPGLVWWSALAVIAVGLQGWLGGVVVKSELHHLLVSLHLGLALLMVSLLLYLVLRPTLRQAARTAPTRGGALVWWVWAAGIGQLSLGAWLRGSIEELQAILPLLPDRALLDQVGAPEVVHIGLGVVLAAASSWLSLRTLARPAAPLTRQAAWALLPIAVLQVAAGFAFRVVGLTPILQLFHLWLASLWVGAIYVLGLAQHLTPPAADQPREPLARWLAGAVGAMLLLALGGLGVIHLADRSRQVPVIQTVPAFTLEAADGGTVTERDLRGRLTVLAFMFTRCPTICPRMTQEMATLYRDYAHAPALVQFLSVTVEPEHDTAAVLQEYARRTGVTDARWRFLRGDIPALQELASKGFYFPTDFPNHSTKLVLIDQQGRVRGFYDYRFPADLANLRQHLRRLARDASTP